ncbi:hypothetical protein QFC22_001237 [Naganishia vaughanmartiniae]|uniref:Uncharacterized protein n=1 Tax=Naganishia vaughanmartiniae TaxID=1424756 RepID=A0ACC2XHE2_9TREE|nr:hypothetical protein QFC22_001237 [Naganishia vaughanmartiniae]
MTFTLQIDDTTLLLLFLLIILSLLPRLFSTTPAAHPLLFAKQAETSTVRRAGKSAVFRHWSTGSAARLSVRPEQGVDGVKELVKSGNGTRWIAGNSVELPRLLKELENGLEALLVHGNEQKGGINRIITCVTTTPTTLLPLVLLNLLPSVSSSNTNVAADTNSTNKQKYQLVTLPRARFLTRALGTFGDARVIVVSLTEAQAMLAMLPSFASSSKGAGMKSYLLVLPACSSTKREEEYPPIPADLGKMAQEKGYEVVLFDEVLRTGRQALARVVSGDKASVDVQEGKSDPDAIHSFIVLPRVTSTTADDHVNVDADADEDPQILTITNSVRPASLLLQI